MNMCNLVVLKVLSLTTNTHKTLETVDRSCWNDIATPSININTRKK